MGGACLKLMPPKTSPISEPAELTSLHESSITVIPESYEESSYPLPSRRSRNFAFDDPEEEPTIASSDFGSSISHSRRSRNFAFDHSEETPLRASSRSRSFLFRHSEETPLRASSDFGSSISHSRVITNVPKEKLYQTEMEKETYFQILHDASCLPRFTYHRSLVDWYVEGLPKDILFTGYRLESCFIIIGGIITDEDNRMLFGETALSERLDIKDLQKEARNHTAFLIVYFFTDNFTKMGKDIEKLDRILHGHGHVLVVMEMECSKDRKNIIENIMTLGISRVEVVIKRRSEIVQRITCTLEQILSSYLVGTKEILLDHSHTHNLWNRQTTRSTIFFRDFLKKSSTVLMMEIRYTL